MRVAPRERRADTTEFNQSPTGGVSMQSHMWGRSAQTVQVRVCTNHVEADPEDPNITCGGLEVRVERASAVNYWTGEHTGPEPDTELVIQRIRSRAKQPEPFDENRLDIETKPVGPALRLRAEEGFDLLRVLTRALRLAREQGLCAERKRLQRETDDAP